MENRLENGTENEVDLARTLDNPRLSKHEILSKHMISSLNAMTGFGFEGSRCTRMRGNLHRRSIATDS